MEKLGIAASDVQRLREVPSEALVSATSQVFNEVPVRNPGTLAFVPIVDGDVLSDYPVKAAQEGRSHPVPSIIGTNKNEAALFRLMRSPLMPITPRAITSMFTQIAAEQPDLQLPTDHQIVAAYPRMLRKSRGLSIATDVDSGCRRCGWPRGTARWRRCYLYRFDYSTPLLRLFLVRAAHATELPYIWGNLGTSKDPTLKLGGAKTARAISRRVRTRWVNFAAQGKPQGPAGEPDWTTYQQADRACLIIDRHDDVVHDLDWRIRAAWGTEMVSFR